MSHPPIDPQEQPARYEIRVKGHLDPRWDAWFAGMALSAQADGTTTVVGPVQDQAALQGLLRKIHDIGLQLLSVVQLDQGPEAQGTDTSPNPSTKG